VDYEFRDVLVVDEGSGITRVTINRPDKLNALAMELIAELCTALEALDLQEDVRLVILDSAGDNAFIAGADIEQMAGMGPLQFRRYASFLRRLARVITGSEKMFIAAVRGAAFGGGNIVVMNCDLVFAAASSKFGQQEIEFGILGGVARLIYLVGARKAWDIMLTGRIVGAQEAEQIGLITKCIPDDQLQEYVMNYARSLAGKSPVALRFAKKLKKISENTDLETAYEYENELISLCFDSEDTKRRLNEFVKQRKMKRTG
jgi:enoyl-CoA hydratase/carnithine racemase